MATLVLKFEKIKSDDETEIFYSNWNAEAITNESDIDNVFESLNVTIIIINFIRSDITLILNWL